MSTEVNIGLEGVLVAESAISNVEGEVGRLSYRGRDIGELVKEPFFAVVLHLLLGSQPKSVDVTSLEKFLLEAGKLSDEEGQLLSHLPRDLHPMLMLQSMTPALSLRSAAPLALVDGVDQLREALIIAAKIPALIANWLHLQNGEGLVPYPADNSFHGNFLRQLTGEKPTELQVRSLDAVQLLQLEHSMNAGTFAGRVVASTQAPVQSVIAASFGALFGKLHGGADQAAVEMAMTVGSPETPTLTWRTP